MTDTVNTYTVKHIEKPLGISVSTVRKYALLLESHGYRISRNENNVRILYEADITVFRRLYEESTKGRTLRKADSLYLKESIFLGCISLNLRFPYFDIGNKSKKY